MRNESDEEAALREVREETGWEVSETLQSLDHTYSYALDDPSRDRWDRVYGPGVRAVHVVSFAALAPSGLDPVLDPAEHDRFGWFGYQEAKTLLDWPVEEDALQDRRAALRALLARLGRHD